MLYTFFMWRTSIYYSMKTTIDFWDKEQVKKLVEETCPSLVSGDGPVFYCKQCMSLGVYAGDFGDTCINCGSTDIGQADMRLYDELYLQKFGKKLFNLD